MDIILKEELWRCVGTFWLALFISIFILKKFFGASFFTLLVFPLIITLLVFLIFVSLRKKLRIGKIIITLIIGFLMINLGIILFSLHKIYLINILLIIFGGISLVYGIVKLISMKNRK